MKIILQSESSECGLACLAMIATFFGHSVDLADLRRKFSVSLKGVTLAQLIKHAALIELTTRPLRLELNEADKLSLPCILHWNLNHFVVLKKIKYNFRREKIFCIIDPAIGERNISHNEFSKCFTGIALEIAPNEKFEQKKETKKLKVRQFTGKIIGIRSAVLKIIILAFSLETFAIVAPLFNQFVIDEVIVGGDQDLLTVLSVGFALIIVIQTFIQLVRSWFLMRWSMDIGFQWSGKVFSHLIRLTVPFFEKRHLGDIMSRFGSINIIQSTITSLLVESFLDGVMAILALGMMLMYSLKLTAIVITSVVLYIIMRWIFFGSFKEASHERLILSAKEGSHFLESLRAITPIKLFGRENQRRIDWQNLKMDVQNRDIKTQKLSIIFKLSNTAISAFQSLSLFYIGAILVMKNELTIGMLMAFSSYATNFSGRIFSLIDIFIGVKMLSLHTERLSDIVLEEVEDATVFETDLDRLSMDITLKNVKFRYAEGENWILNDVNMTIKYGQSIAIIGPSGCGKSTLCKILLGLLKPTEGDILIGEISLRQMGLGTYRTLVGTVMQDDVLLAGSILENICFFETAPDKIYIEKAATLASIHNEICAMPMGYQTLVGDMGSSLSGGQKQRILLARALYKNPKIIALDEATSHLDLSNEEIVTKALANLSLTRIMIAHRTETIASAKMVIKLQDGRITEVRNDYLGVE